MHLNLQAYNFTINQLYEEFQEITHEFNSFKEKLHESENVKANFSSSLIYYTTSFMQQEFQDNMEKILRVTQYYKTVDPSLDLSELKKISNSLICIYTNQKFSLANNQKCVPIIEKYINIFHKEYNLYNISEFLSQFSNISFQNYPFIIKLVSETAYKNSSEVNTQKLLEFIRNNQISVDNLFPIKATELLECFLKNEKFLQPKMIKSILIQNIVPNAELYHFLKIQITVLGKGDTECLDILQIKWEKSQLDSGIAQPLVNQCQKSALKI